jgi:hypothetical protein
VQEPVLQCTTSSLLDGWGSDFANAGAHGLQLEATGTMRAVGQHLHPSVDLVTKVDELSDASSLAFDFASRALSVILPSHIQDQTLLALVNVISELLQSFDQERLVTFSAVYADGCDSAVHIKHLDQLQLEISALRVENEHLRALRLKELLDNIQEPKVVDGQVFSDMQKEITDKTEEIRVLREQLLIVSKTFCLENEAYCDDLRCLTQEHENMKAEMALNRTKELEEMKVHLESTIAEKSDALAKLSEAHETLSESNRLLELKFSAFLVAHESENSALLSEKAHLAFEIARLKQAALDAASALQEKSRSNISEDFRIRDRETHDFYQFEIVSRDEKLLWGIAKMTSALMESYANAQALEREVSIFPHKMNVADLKCARLIEGQAQALANMARKDAELASMNQRLKGFLHEVESYSIKYNLLEKKCAELEEESAVNKKLFEASAIELEAYEIAIC